MAESTKFTVQGTTGPLSKIQSNALKYIYLNPVKPGIVQHAERYKWSTLNLHHRKFKKLIVKNTNGFEEYVPQVRSELVRWVNQPRDGDYIEAVGRALKRHEFKFPRGDNGFREDFDYALFGVDRSDRGLLRRNTTDTSTE